MPVALPPVTDQAERLIDQGVHELSGLTAADLRSATHTDAESSTSLLVIHPDLAPASRLAPLLRREGKAGFIVTDMTDVDAFMPIPEAALPASQVYRVEGIDRGDTFLNWTPNEALPKILAGRRTPLTASEGIFLLLQRPDLLERGRCFMTIGSRMRKQTGALDARTPALWISNGTGRDGRENAGAPKLGWCWAGNRHTWLGIASAEARAPLT